MMLAPHGRQPPFPLPSGPATGFFNGLHPKIKLPTMKCSRSQFLRTTAAAFVGLVFPHVNAEPSGNPDEALPAKLAVGEMPPPTGELSGQLRLMDDIIPAFLKSAKIPGCTVAVIANGKVLANRGYGWSDKELSTAMQPNAVMRVGICEEPVVVTALKLLVAEKHILPVSKKPLTLDMKYFELVEREFRVAPIPRDQMIPALENLTLRDIVEHRVTLRQISAFGREPRTYPTYRDAIRDMRTSPALSLEMEMRADGNSAPKAVYEVGQKEDTVAAGLYLLRFLVSQCTGDYPGFLKKRVFGPSGAGDAVVQSRNVPRDRDPREGHYWFNGQGFSMIPSDFGKNKLVPFTEGCSECEIVSQPAFSAEGLAKYLQHFGMGSNEAPKKGVTGVTSVCARGDRSSGAILEQRPETGCSMAVLFDRSPDNWVMNPKMTALRDQIVKTVFEPNKL